MVIGDELNQPLQVDQEDVEQVNTVIFLSSYFEKKIGKGNIYDCRARNSYLFICTTVPTAFTPSLLHRLYCTRSLPTNRASAIKSV